MHLTKLNLHQDSFSKRNKSKLTIITKNISKDICKAIKVKEFKANEKLLIHTKYHSSKKQIMNLKQKNSNGDTNRLLIKRKINRKKKKPNSFFYSPNQKDYSLAS